MAIFAISDLHLSLGTNKPMDVFSSKWENYVEKLKINWIETIKESDTVIISGDVSWATYLKEAKKDFEFLNQLPGTKIISKGNHDYWWSTVSKMDNFIKENEFDKIFFLHNNFYIYQDYVICGTKGWCPSEKELTEEDKKIFNREQERLELSLKKGKNSGKKNIIVSIHYPPFYSHSVYGFIEIMKKYNVKTCLYGHLHKDFSVAKQGIIEGIEIKLVSADYLNFKPKKIL